MIFIRAVKAGAGTKAGLVQWQKAAPPTNCLRVVGEGFSAGKVVKNGLGFLLLGFCVVGTSLDKSQTPLGRGRHVAHRRMGAAHAQPLWVPWKQQIIYCCLYKAGGKDEECLSQSIGGENLYGNTYREVVPVWLLQRAHEAQLLLPCSPHTSQGAAELCLLQRSSTEK